jgi:hypothetical protein
MALNTIEEARRAQSDVVASMSDMLHGFRTFLIRTHIFPSETDFTLLFIEIHGPDGMPLDECDDEDIADAQEEEDEKSLEGKIGHIAQEEKPGTVVVLNVTVVNGQIAPKSMNEPTNCESSAPIKIQPDLSAIPKLPPDSNDSWPVMTAPPSTKHFMNLPGLDGRSPPDLQTAVQTEAKVISSHDTAIVHIKPIIPVPQIKSIKAIDVESHSVHTRRHFVDDPVLELNRDSKLGLSSLAQEEWRIPSSPSQHMKSIITEDVMTNMGQDSGWLKPVKTSSDVSMKEMPEADLAIQAPAGGFPVPDNDDGTL